MRERRPAPGVEADHLQEDLRPLGQPLLVVVQLGWEDVDEMFSCDFGVVVERLR